MRLALGLIAGALVIFATSCADPKECAAWPRVNRLQNLLGYGLGVACILWGLGGAPR